MALSLGFVMLLHLFPSASSSAQPPASSSSDTNLYSGIYHNGNGSQARLFKPDDADAWVMNVSESGGGDYTVIMKGTAEKLEPVGLNLSVTYRGKPMNIVADGGTLYGRGKSGKQDVEIYADDQQKMPRSTIDRKSASSAEAIETRMLAQRYQASWDRIRSSSVAVNESGLTITPSQPTRAGKHAEQSKALQRFEPQAALEEDDQLALAGKLKSWQNNLTDRDHYLKSLEGSSEQ